MGSTRRDYVVRWPGHRRYLLREEVERFLAEQGEDNIEGVFYVLEAVGIYNDNARGIYIRWLNGPTAA